MSVPSCAGMSQKLKPVDGGHRGGFGWLVATARWAKERRTAGRLVAGRSCAVGVQSTHPRIDPMQVPCRPPNCPISRFCERIDEAQTYYASGLSIRTTE